MPFFKNNEIITVLDIGSEQLNTFDTIGQKRLEKVVGLVVCYAK
jgi:putative methionine-R-sulfoxide reductase with GAF domain